MNEATGQFHLIGVMLSNEESSDAGCRVQSEPRPPFCAPNRKSIAGNHTAYPKAPQLLHSESMFRKSETLKDEDVL